MPIPTFDDPRFGSLGDLKMQTAVKFMGRQSRHSNKGGRQDTHPLYNSMAEQAADPLDGLEERLQNHAKAFESLLALTPARDHYGSQIDDGLDPSEQWNRKKQTKEQKRAAKKAKLDPANQKSALDVMKDRERKRKRELGIEEESEVEATEISAKAINSPAHKRQKQAVVQEDDETIRKLKAEKRKEKRDAKKQKAAAKKIKQEAKKAAREDRDLASLEEEETDAKDNEPSRGNGEEDGEDGLNTTTLTRLEAADNNASDVELRDEDEASSTPTSPVLNSPAFDLATNHSEASSSSSITPPSVPEQPAEVTRRPPPSATSTSKIALSTVPEPSNTLQQPSTVSDLPSGMSSPKLQLPKIDQAQLQERLRKRIEELRQRRNADGIDGKPARSRQELLEQRRKKEEQRKAHKKELRRQARDEEAQKREEQLRGSGSPMASDIFSRGSPRPAQDNSFTFSRLAFQDGTAADASLSELRDPKRKKGPQDPGTALQAAEKKRSRLAGLDAEKRADIADKDMWLNANKRAHGERIRDDTSLLKKALKRKEKSKNQSEKQWKEREEAVTVGKERKQKKREANLQKRRDEKGQKGKKKPLSAKGKKKARPGFEGRGFKA